MILWKEYSLCFFNAWFLKFFAVEAFTVLWIEIFNDPYIREIYLSRLSQPRGLKLHYNNSVLFPGPSRLSQPRWLKYHIVKQFLGLSCRGFHSLIVRLFCRWFPCWRIRWMVDGMQVCGEGSFWTSFPVSDINIMYYGGIPADSGRRYQVFLSTPCNSR